MIATCRGASLLSSWLLLAAVTACGDSDPGSKPWECDEGAALTALAIGVPPGVAPGEPYRWLARSWRSPLGLTIRTYGLAVDGIPVAGRHQVEVYDGRGALVHRAGSGDAVLARLRAQGATASTARRARHPLAARVPSQRPRRDPLSRDEQRPVWHYAGGDLAAAVAVERLDLTGQTPIGEVSVRDAVTGLELARRRTIFDLADPEYLVYAREDGRPMYSPLGDTYPHPTGVPDGRVSALVPQRSVRQSMVSGALDLPWVATSSRETYGPNVVAFFNSLLDHDGKIAELSDEEGKETPEYGPFPDELGHDFFAQASDDRFAFSYDASAAATQLEYFQDGEVGTSAPPPDQDSVATNAKIVQAFYAANWLHDFFYAAGFDEAAGNAQLSNYGRGGLACDPLIVHSGFLETFTFVTEDGTSPVLDLGVNRRSGSRRDTSMDFSVLSHEWGHYLIGRLAGGVANPDAMGNLQGQALHEGIADFVGVLVNLDGDDDLQGAFAVGSYSNLDYFEFRPTLPAAEARADAAYYGIRRYPYSLDFARNPLTFRHLAEPPPLDRKFFNWKGRGPQLAEIHTTGEIFSQSLFQCFGNLVAANPGKPFEELRARMAQYLVAALTAFPDRPTLLEARDAFLTVIRLTSPSIDYPACRAGFASRGMGSGARGPDRNFVLANRTDPYNAADVRESFVDAD
jgi:hypothetical protein